MHKTALYIALSLLLLTGAIAVSAQETPIAETPIVLEELPTQENMTSSEIIYKGLKEMEDKISTEVASSSSLLTEKEAYKQVRESQETLEITQRLDIIIGLLRHQNQVLLK